MRWLSVSTWDSCHCKLSMGPAWSQQTEQKANQQAQRAVQRITVKKM